MQVSLAPDCRVGRSLAIAILAALSLPADARAGSCLTPGDSSNIQIATLNGIMWPDNPDAAFLRGHVGIAALDSTDVQLVSDDSICAQVDSAIMSISEPALLQSHVVYRIGANRFAAFSPGWSLTGVLFINDRKQVLAMTR
ncbi:MAG TPA: hypothetical protein VM033_05230 [Gemmatimonadaceae bacterium]|nr:hypothetical protein [Gemmatimonadaceae bacterium]